MKQLTAATALMAVAFQVPTQAQSLDAELGGIDFSVHGFATAGGVVSNTNDAEFVRGAEVSGAGKTPTENVDSNLGVQATARFNSWISATVQVLEDSSTATDPIAWAYVKIEPVSNLSIKLGKIEIPLFMISDSRDIGYANTWVRPPNEVYALGLDEELKGGEATYTIPVGHTHVSVTAYAGNSLTNAYDAWDVLKSGECVISDSALHLIYSPRAQCAVARHPNRSGNAMTWNRPRFPTAPSRRSLSVHSWYR